MCITLIQYKKNIAVLSFNVVKTVIAVFEIKVSLSAHNGCKDFTAGCLLIFEDPFKTFSKTF